MNLLILAITFLLLIATSTAETNHTETITVSAYSAFIASLPHTDFKFIDNGIVNVIEKLLPADLHIDVASLVTRLSSTFYVFVFIVVFSLVIVSLLVVSVLQCFCNICGSSQVKYSSVQRGSAYFINFLLLFTVAISSSIAIYFFLNSTAAAKENLGDIRTEIDSVHNLTDTLNSSIASLVKLNVYNVSLPDPLYEIFNTTDHLQKAIHDPSIDKTFSFNWIPIVSLIFLVVLAVGSCTSAYFRVRVVYLILGYLFFLSFLILAASSIGSVSFGAFLSNFCASGIDTNMRIIIDAFHSDNNTCIEEVGKKLLFCNAYNSTCDPFSEATTEINIGIDYVKKAMENSTDPKLPLALAILESMKGNVTKLENCSSTSQFYHKLTNDVCLNSVGSLVNLSTSLELISLLIFLFLLTALYTWHRISALSKMGQGYDYESISQTNRTKSELNPTDTPDNDCSTGCFLHIIIMLVFWGAFTFGAFVVLSFGAAETDVPRN